MRAVSEQEAGLRLDRWFQRHFPELSHGALQKLLRTGQVRIDGRRAEGKDRVEPGQTIRLPPGVTTTPPPKPREIATVSDRDAAEIQRLVIHKDDHVIVLNKPPGLAVQGGTGTERHVDGMLDALRFGFEDRPRLVHRLDKDTSGVLLIARTGQAAKRLGASFRDRETEKLYWAVVVGLPPKPEGAIDLPLAKRPGARGDRELMQVDPENGQKALTHFRMVDRAGKRAAFLALWPRTGRTHQLRVHCAAIGCPILGDGKYGGEEALLAPVADARRLHLHARRKRLLDKFDLLLDGVDNLDGVRAGLSAHVERDGLLAIDHVPGVGFGKTVFNAADIADANGRAVDIGDYYFAELADGVDAPQRPDAQFGFASNDPAAGNLDVFALNRSLELADSDVVGVESLGVGKDAYLAIPPAGHANLADAVHGLQHPLDLFVSDFGGFSKTLIAGHHQ